MSRVELDGDQVSSILEAARVFEDNGARFGSVDGVGPGGVEATVGGRSVIFSGSVGAERARALVDLMEDHPEVSLFDLRSPDRVIVRGDGGDGESEG
ncbi:MAG: hypothetical protein ACRDSJ_20120 [Rubrobacteraceae bacterium]